MTRWHKTHRHGKCIKCNQGYVWECSLSKEQSCSCGQSLTNKFRIANTRKWTLLHRDKGQRIEVPLADHPKYFPIHPQNRFTGWPFVSGYAVAMRCDSQDSGEFTKRLITINFKKEAL